MHAYIATYVAYMDVMLHTYGVAYIKAPIIIIIERFSDRLLIRLQSKNSYKITFIN